MSTIADFEPVAGGGIGSFIDTSIAISSDDTALANDDGTANNIAIGLNAGNGITAGANSVLIGTDVGFTNSLTKCFGLGYKALYAATAGGTNNVAIGDSALYEVSAGGNIAVGGWGAGRYITSGMYNIGIGQQALYGNSTSKLTGSYNTGIGYQSGYSLTTGQYNVLSGYQAGYGLTTGEGNVFIGRGTGDSNNTSFCTAIGNYAGRYATGLRSTYVGAYSGEIHTGATCVYVGAYAGQNTTTGAGNVFLGYQAGKNETASNKLHIANNSTESLIEGDFSAKTLNINGALTVNGAAVGGAAAMEYISTQTISSNTTQVEFDLSDTDYEYFVVKAEGCKVASSPSNGYFVYFNFYDGAYNSSSPTTNKMNFMYQRTQTDGSSVTTSTQFASDAKLFVSWTPSTSTVFGFDAEVGGKLNSRVNIQSNMVTGTTNAGSPSCQAQCPNTSNNMTYMIIKLASVDFSAGTFKLYGIKD
jgi:hypothetical protein